MNIESLYKDYVQKSKIFLYPALDVKRGNSVTPIQTYISWEGYFKKEDCKLMAVYHLRQDTEFRQFERVKLLGNPLFHDFKMIDENKGIYIFDFDNRKEDWFNFTQGKYSKLSKELKLKIQTFFGVSNRGYVDSFLYPERYFKMYAEFFTVCKEDHEDMHTLLKSVGELCSKPEPESENLIANIKDLHMTKKSL